MAAVAFRLLGFGVTTPFLLCLLRVEPSVDPLLSPLSTLDMLLRDISLFLLVFTVSFELVR